MTDDKQSLIDALRLGEAACLTMIIFEPLQATLSSKWERAAKIIAAEIKKLEALEAV
jgi:hypothetical protein